MQKSDYQIANSIVCDETTDVISDKIMSPKCERVIKNQHG